MHIKRSSKTSVLTALGLSPFLHAYELIKTVPCALPANVENPVLYKNWSLLLSSVFYGVFWLGFRGFVVVVVVFVSLLIAGNLKFLLCNGYV